MILIVDYQDSVLIFNRPLLFMVVLGALSRVLRWGRPADMPYAIHNYLFIIKMITKKWNVGCSQRIMQEFNLDVWSHISSDLQFCFLIFLFIITEFIIHSKFWGKCTVFKLLFHLAITFHSCYFWKSWVLQLYFSVWHIESKSNLKTKKAAMQFLKWVCCLGLNIQFPFS